MQGISENLLKTIGELQKLPSLANSSLGGGTNLSIRYQHRFSDDIDLIFPGIIGRSGYEAITNEITDLYRGAFLKSDYPLDIDDQFMFQRFWLVKDDENIKIDILQNMQTHDAPDLVNGFLLTSEMDIGLLKLMTAANRASRKDIYDLDYITDHIPLTQLMKGLHDKLVTYSKPEHRSIFYPEDKNNPFDSPELLLKFESPVDIKPSKPNHSNQRLDPVDGQKNWNYARSSWRSKVRAYFREIGKDFPRANAIQ
jgi:hypothetical protein